MSEDNPFEGMDIQFGQVFAMPEEQPCGQCRACILSTALGFVADVTAVHGLPEEPWTSSQGAASSAFAGGHRVVVSSAEHVLDLALRVADWLLDVEAADE